MQLRSVGVPAIHGYNASHVSSIKAGKFRFGQLCCNNAPDTEVQFCIPVFISPETGESMEWRALFMELNRRGRIATVAVDEAHCVAEW